MDSSDVPTLQAAPRGRRGSITDTVPSNKAKQLLAGLAMTPPKTPPPASALTPTRAKAAVGFKAPIGGGRIKELSMPEAAPAPESKEAPAAEGKAGAGGAPGPMVAGSEVIHEGWLLKLKQKNETSLDAKWNRRYFVIRDGFLLYYRNNTSKFPAGWLRLAQITSIEAVPTDVTIPGTPVTPPFAFKVCLAARVLYLQAKSMPEVAMWKAFLLEEDSGDATPVPAPAAATTPVKAKKGALPPIVVAARGSPPTAAQSPMRSPKKRSIFKNEAASPEAKDEETKDEETKDGSVGEEDPAADVPSDAVWVKCMDVDSGYPYYLNQATEITVWELPLTDADDGHWIKCFDFDAGATFFAHNGTRDEAYTTEMPTYQPGEWHAPESGLVWIESWDDATSTPYFMNFATGESQWEYPTEPGCQVVQHGSEDYAWYWNWLSGTEEGAEGENAAPAEAAPAAPAVKALAIDEDKPASSTGPLTPVLSNSKHNMFGSAFA